MAHYNIFREQLAIKYPAYGHPLWEPNPGRLYSPVEIGDVGYVREGKFHRLFNALLPADHPSHRTFGVPEHHIPLVPNPSEHIDVGTLKPSHLCSHGISVTTGESDFHARPDDLPQVSYQCSKRQRGAVSFLPVSAQRQDTIARGDFGQWIIKNIGIWFTFARRLGLGIEQMEDIILVTGFHRTRSWANVAFLESHTDAQVSFGVEVTDANGPGMNIKWRFSPERVRGALLSWGPDGKNLPEDQCVFLRGFRVTRTLRILPKHLIAAAGPSSDPDEHDDEPDPGLIPIPAIAQYRDPLHLMLGHISENAPDCNMVLVHDDDLARIAEIHGDNEPLQIDVIDLLQQSRPEIQQVQYYPPGAGKHSSTTGKESTTVAMFSWEFQEWGQSHVSREESNTQLSPRVPSPTLRPPPSYASSEYKESALPSRLADDPGTPQQRVEKTRGSGDAHSMLADQPDSKRALLQGSNSGGSELGSRATSRQGIVGANFNTGLLATSSARPITPPFPAEPPSIIWPSMRPVGPQSSVESISGVVSSNAKTKTYHLEVIQEPEVSAEFGSATLSRVPLAPPLVAQLTVRDSRGNIIESDPEHTYLICHLSLHSADGLTTLDPVSPLNRQFPPDRLLYGNLVSSPHYLRNLQGHPGVYFLFPDVSVKLQGRYMLQLTLMRLSGVDASGMVRVGESGTILAQIRTRPFDVRPRHIYVAPPQTPLTELFLQQGARMYVSASPSSRFGSEGSF